MTVPIAIPITVEYVPLGDLRSVPFNPRKISEQEMENLCRSVAEFGLVDPIIVRKADGRIIAGHQRLLAARRLGLEVVPAVFLDISLEKARLLAVTLNRIGGTFDDPLLARLLAELDDIPDVDLTVTGLGEDEIARLLKSLSARERRERIESFDLDAALEAAQAAHVAQRGDLWRLGDHHRLACCDATDVGDVSRLLGERKAAMAFTDPPYNVSLGDHGGQQRGSRRRRIANDALPPEAWEAFVRSWAENLLQYVDGAIYICMSSKEWPLVSRVLEELGGHWSDTVIWAKDRFVLGRADYQRQYEPVWYGWREGAPHHWCGDRDQGDVWTIPRPAESELHPTMKPLALVERAIENSSKPGHGVLDLFLGSGTTLIAAERTGRVCYAMELEPAYVDVAIRRWEAFTGERAEEEREST